MSPLYVGGGSATLANCLSIKPTYATGWVPTDEPFVDVLILLGHPIHGQHLLDQLVLTIIRFGIQRATIGALGVLSNNRRIYPARPVLISGDCKHETGRQHAEMIQTLLDGVNSKRPATKLRIMPIGSDGETLLELTGRAAKFYI
ncbi:hypothetical protein FPV67DRAFT_1672080 [Lyophyllum atratum]|nr:hypothetical protein FPV67DRAFT_1672080 [Lyophyllum atratum]